MFVSLCLASSVDGRIAAGPGRSPDFTSREDLAKLFRLRAESDVLLIGATTVRNEQVLPLVRDKSLAEARLAAGLTRHPAAVIVSPSLNLPLDGRYFRYRKQRMVVLTEVATPEQIAAFAAVQVEVLCTGAPLDLTEGLRQLAALGFQKCLAEGGGRLVHGLLQADLVDRLYLTLAPFFFGGTETPLLVQGPSLEPARKLRLASVEPIGDELHLVYERLLEATLKHT